MKKGIMLFLTITTFMLTLFITIKSNEKAEAKWYFSRINMDKCVIKLSKNNFYRTGEEIRPEVTVTFQGDTLKENVDYELVYMNNVEEGEARIKVKGINDYRGKKNVYFKIVTIDICNTSIFVENDSYVWTGEYIMPKVEVYYKNVQLIEDEDYYLYYYDNKDAGTATVGIYGMNKFSGRVLSDFEIKGIDISEGKIVEKEGQIYVYLDDVLLDRDDYYMPEPIELSSRKIGRYNEKYDLYRVVYKYRVDGKGIYSGTIEDIIEMTEKRFREPTPAPTVVPTPTVKPTVIPTPNQTVAP